HPLDQSWGYQTIGYYSASSRYGDPKGLKAFIDKCHQNEIGVILDFAYSHFCKDNHGLYKFDGSAQFEYSDSWKAENIGWGTAHFDLGKPEVNSFLLSNVLYWFKEFHIDGIRVDAVSSMLYLDYDSGEWRPNKYGGRENLEAIDFIKRLNETAYEHIENPLIIAEESTAWPMVTGPTYKGALGFTYKWNMGWMNDTLKYMEMDPVYRKHHHELITFSFMYAFSENFILPLSHDEVVHGKKSLLDKMPGDPWQKFAGLRTLYAYYMIHPGKKLLFMGSEFGQGLEWRYAYGLEWELLEREPHIKMQEYVKDLNNLYKNEKAMHEIDNSYEGFDFIDANNKDQSVVVLMRKGKKPKDFVIAIINFTPVVHYDYKIGVPYYGTYEEVLNTDSEKYWGSGQTMEGNELVAVCEKWHNKDYHIKVKVPPMGVTFIKGKNITLDTVEINKDGKVLIGGKNKKIKTDKAIIKEL
ncbi:MAG: 1,4-alpha-glucan branching protein GlgB, partial [Romboutsia sp.]|uniref:1,4-alpha-glucan branching protein GlgB n=1 Tax=Romboutsia sp. TaxID=1965302 RepID=UPI003F41939F